LNKTVMSLAIAGLLLAAAISVVGAGAIAGGLKANAEPAPAEPASPVHLPEAAETDAKWTIMVYLDGDNNLETDALADLREMEAVGSKNGVNVVVLMDTLTLLGGTHWYFLGEGNTHVDMEAGFHHCDCELVTGTECPGELNMGDGPTLTYFTETAMTFAPAENYMLVLWDHGGGWYGVCWDDSSEMFPDSGRVDRLTIDEAANALYAAGLGPEGEKLSIIGFDACLMSMVEIAYENRHLADYMLASVTSIPNAGWDYTPILENLTADPDMDAVELGTVVVDSYVEFYSMCSGNGLKGMNWAGLSLLDLSKIPDLALGPEGDGGLNALAEALMPYTTNYSYRGLIIQSLQSVTPLIQTYGQQFAYIDIGVFLSLLGEKIPALSNITSDVADLLEPAVLYVRYVSGEMSGPTINTNGLTLYFPVAYYYTYEDYGFETYEESEDAGALPYYGLDFASDTLWDEFILAFSMAYTEDTEEET